MLLLVTEYVFKILLKLHSLEGNAIHIVSYSVIARLQ